MKTKDKKVLYEGENVCCGFCVANPYLIMSDNTGTLLIFKSDLVSQMLTFKPSLEIKYPSKKKDNDLKGSPMSKVASTKLGSTDNPGLAC